MSAIKMGTGLIPPQVKRFLDWAKEDPESFWEDAAYKAAHDIYWFKKWEQVFSWQYPHLSGLWGD